MQPALLYWHWLVFGMILMILEIFIPSFTIFWFGLAGIAVAGFLWLMPDLAFSWQLFIWSLASGVLTFLWFKFFRPLMIDRTKAGISKEAVVGEFGHVIKVSEGRKEGVIRFAIPLLGANEWQFISEDEVNAGDRVFVRDISGNTLIVGKQELKGTSI